MQMRLVGMLMGGALIGKLLGFVREIVIARMLGAGIVADGFRAAITVVLLPLSPLQGDLVPAVLVPLHREWSRTGTAPVRFACMTALFGLVALVIASVVFEWAESWTSMVVGGFGPQALALTTQFVRVMSLAMPASAVLVCLSSIELALGLSRLTSLRASVQNVSVLIGVVMAGLTGHTIAIAWFFAIPFNALAAWGLWTLCQDGRLAMPAWHPAGALAVAGEFSRRVRTMLAQPLAEQGNIWLERILGSRSGTGAIASLDYARTLTESALFLVSQPIGYAVLGADHGVLPPRRRVEAVGRPVLALTMPASVFLIMAAPDIVQLVFVRGAFQDKAAELTSGALVGISVGLWAATLGWILVRVLNAQARNAAAATVLVCSYAVNALVNFCLVSKFGPLGLGLGEAARGIVLLVGAAMALSCSRTVLWMVLQVTPACLGLAWVEHLINGSVDQALPRLLLGGIAFTFVAGLMLVATSPTVAGRPFSRLLMSKASAKRALVPGALATGMTPYRSPDEELP